MSSFKLYDSEGNEVRPDGSRGGSSNRIKQFFYAGVRLGITFNRSPEAVVFLRAREGSGRAEQYYAVYQADSRRNLLEDVHSTVRRRVENDYGMTIVESTEDTRVFETLASPQKRLPGSEFDRDLVSKLAKDGRTPRIGVGGVNEALSLISALSSDSGARSFAVADEPGHSALSEFAVAIDVGRYSGIEPLGNTVQAMQQGRQEMEDRFISNKMGNIKEEIHDLRQQTDISNQKLRHRLKQEISVLETDTGMGGQAGGASQYAPGGSSGGGGGLGSDDSKLPNLDLGGFAPLLVGGAIVILLLVAGIYVVTPATGQAGWFCGAPGYSAKVCAPPDLKESGNTAGIVVSGPASSNTVTIRMTFKKNGNQVFNKTVNTSDSGKYKYTITNSELDGGWPENSSTYQVRVNIPNGGTHINEFKSNKSWGNQPTQETATPTPTQTPTSEPTPTNATNGTQGTETPKLGSISDVAWDGNNLTVTASIDESNVNLNDTKVSVNATFDNENVTAQVGPTLSSIESTTVVLNITFDESFNKSEDGDVHLFINGSVVDSQSIPEPSGGTNSLTAAVSVRTQNTAPSDTKRSPT